jgi:hypothetical protein
MRVETEKRAYFENWFNDDALLQDLTLQETERKRSTVASRGDLVVLDAPGTQQEGYARVTSAILEGALRLAQQALPSQPEVLAVAVWDGVAQGLAGREILTR